KSSELEIHFHGTKKPIPDEDNKLWRLYGFECPSTPNGCSEDDVEELLQPFFDELTNLIRLACQFRGNLGSWITISKGYLTKKRRENGGGNCDNKKPDRAAFWTDGKNALPHPEAAGDFDAKDIPCLLVGDIKMAEKFNGKMLRSNRG